MDNPDEQDKTIVSQQDTRSQAAKTRHCPKCGLQVTPTALVCPQDGTSIIEGPGTILASTYEFLSVTGYGGMSVIYKARDRESRQIVAIKMLHSLVMTDSHLKRFEQEAKAISSLRHPNIITVHEFNVSEHGQPYMVMDFVDGQNLGEVIREHGPLSVEESLPRFLQLCDALEHAHKQGVLHRDLKPSNIMLSSKEAHFEDARIVDFGIAKLLDKQGPDDGALTQTGELFGSPLYMSPEQCRDGSLVDARSDIYSMGCVMYETLTGRPPLRGSSIVETILMQTNTVPPPLHQAAPEGTFPPDLETVIAKALQKDPADRFQSMTELKVSLLQIHPDKTVAQLEQSSRPLGKRTVVPKVAYLVVAAFVAGAAIPLVVLVTRPKPVPPPPVQEFLTSKPMTGRNLATLPRDQWTDSDLLDSLRRKPGLRELWLDDALRITDDGLQDLGDLHYLKTVALDFTRTGDETLKKLANTTTLTKLQLRSTMITDAGIKFLSKLSSLGELHLTSTDITDAAMSTIGTLKQLQHLSLSNTNIDDAGIAHLKGLPLRVLDLSNTKITDAGAQTLGTLTSLQDLNLHGTHITDAGINALKSLTSLQKLSLSDTQISDKGLSALQSFPNLNELSLDNDNITDTGATALGQLKSLDNLNIPNTRITDQALIPIASLKLRNLNVSWDNVTDVGLKTIGTMKGLRDLDLRGTKITTPGLNALQPLTTLKTVSLQSCVIIGSLAKLRQELPETNFKTHY